MVSKTPGKPKLKDVLLSKIKVCDAYQRDLDEPRVNTLLSHFDLDQIGYPILSERDGYFYAIDGQHRVESVKRWLGLGWERQKITCSVYQNLTIPDEAEMYLRYNDFLNQSAYTKFNAAITAHRPDECAIKRAVEAQGLSIGKGRTPGCICAVGTLGKAYRRSDAETLGLSLRIIRDAFGDAGFEAAVIDGINLLCKRYNGQLDEQRAKDKLGATRGGVKGLMNRAEEIKLRTGNVKGHCVAAAAVDIINSGKGRNTLPSWWGDA